MESGRASLLRHDFRATYGCSYDEVPTDEAIDLVRTLGPGSLYRASLDPRDGWTNQEHQLADVADGISRLTHMLSDARTTEGADLAVRPGHAEAQAAAIARARDVRRHIEETEWEEVDGG